MANALSSNASQFATHTSNQPYITKIFGYRSRCHCVAINFQRQIILHFYRSLSYNGASNFNALLTPLTFLISYFNSAINPLLYAFLSRNFRKGMREIILCSLKKDNTKSLQQRIPMHVSKSLFWHINWMRFFCEIFQKSLNTNMTKVSKKKYDGLLHEIRITVERGKFFRIN